MWNLDNVDKHEEENKSHHPIITTVLSNVAVKGFGFTLDPCHSVNQ